MAEAVAWMLEWEYDGEQHGQRLYDDERHCLLDAESDGGVCTPLVRLADYEALRKRCEAVEGDAARYRWLRANAVVGRMESRGPRPDFAMNCDEPESEWDACIDSHIAAAQEPSHG